MPLTPAQIAQFHEDGVLLLPGLFRTGEVARLGAAFAEIARHPAPADIREKDSGAVRTAMGLHQRHETFATLIRHPRLIEPAAQLLGTREFYTQQVKINVKAAFEGEAWQWHYDFATHHQEDGVPSPLALNLHVFLDEVTQFNGPLHFIIGSHRAGPQASFLDRHTTSYDLWCVEREVVASLTNQGGLFAATGKAGTALIFGDCMVHCSPPNLSPWDRRIFSQIVNPISNAYTRDNRPEWKHHRDLSPVLPLDDDCLSSQG